MYRILKRPILTATLSASISLPIIYYSHAMKPRLSTPLPSAQDSVPPATTNPKQPSHQTPSPPPTTNLSTPYTATFSIPMHCNDCIVSISTALAPLKGIHSTTFSLPTNTLTVTGTTPPSAIVTAIQDTGRTAILRGSGRPGSAAVCILEMPWSPSSSLSSKGLKEGRDGNGGADKEATSSVRGLARLIELSDHVTMLDLTLTGLAPGKWRASVRVTGDISRGRESVGGLWWGEDGDREGSLGDVDVGEDGRAGLVGEVGWRVWEVVGRGVVVERVGEGEGDEGDRGREGEDVVMGVVARSAGAWENEKVVCACSGKTVWEEREEMVGKGMM